MPPVYLKIIIGYSLFFILHVLGPGAAWLAIIRKRFSIVPVDEITTILQTLALGILFNTLAFAGTVMAHHFNLSSPSVLIIIKLGLDWLMIGIMAVYSKDQFGEIIKEWRRLLNPWENRVILTLSLILGLIAVYFYPHVLDCGQLMETNRFWKAGYDFLQSKRWGWAFSTLIYYPTAIMRSLPMTTIASGNKLFLFPIISLTTIYGMKRIRLNQQPILIIIYWLIIIFSDWGLKGAMALGKDSNWAVLFSIIAFFSLIKTDSGYDRWSSCLFCACACALGMIAIPYILIFMTVYLVIRWMPILHHRRLFLLVLLFELGLSWWMMPIQLPIANLNAVNNPLFGSTIHYSYPFDNQTPFIDYLFKNPETYLNNFNLYNIIPPYNWIVLIGMIGMVVWVVLPRFHFLPDLKSFVLFIPTSIMFSLLLAVLFQSLSPSKLGGIAALFPNITLYIWNLAKDIPLWYIQIIWGIFVVLLIDIGLVETRCLFPNKIRFLEISIMIIITLGMVYNQWMVIRKLVTPIYYYSFGGDKNRSHALVMENLYLNPKLFTLYVSEKNRVFNSSFYYTIKHYYIQKSIYPISRLRQILIKNPSDFQPVMMIAKEDEIDTVCQAIFHDIPWYLYQLDKINKGRYGIFILSKEVRDYRSTNRIELVRVMESNPQGFP